MTIEEFIEEHRKVCSGRQRNKKHCAKSIFKYLKKWAPERIEIYNKVTSEKRAELLKTKPV